MSKFKTFKVTGWVPASVSTKVRARSKKEAREIAMNDRPTAGFCHECAEGGEESVEWTNPYELDAASIRIVEVSVVDEDDEE